MDADRVVAQGPNGEPEAPPEEYVTFFRQQYAAVMVIAMHAGATSPEADDAAARTMDTAFTHWSAIDNPHAWARRKVVRFRVDMRRADQRRRDRELKYTAGIFVRPPDVMEICLQGDGRVPEELLDRLTSHQKQIVKLILADLSADEIGVLLGKTPDAVKRSISNIRRRLEDKTRAMGSGASGSLDEGGR